MHHKTPLPSSLLLISALVAAAHAGTVDLPDPIPILPGSAVYSPGPRRLGFASLAQDPSSIGNFRGLVALAYLRGKVRDASGHRFLMNNDMRILQGDYVAADGIERHGTFGFV